jgi:hypothetical protein
MIPIISDNKKLKRTFIFTIFIFLLVVNVTGFQFFKCSETRNEIIQNSHNIDRKSKIDSILFNYFSIKNNTTDQDDDDIPDFWEELYDLDPQDPSDAGLDNDEDGLTNLQEYQYNTNPLIQDSDGDGIDDGEEVESYSTNPSNPDTDNDKMPDGYEIDNNLNPIVADGGLDDDYDDLDNYEEFLLGTDPWKKDTDGDGYNDGFEIDKGTNPLDSSDHPTKIWLIVLLIFVSIAVIVGLFFLIKWGRNIFKEMSIEDE